jgi:branched-chain amino acid transport system permease protein
MVESAVAGLGTGAVYAIFAVGLVVVFKTTRVLNFAQAEVGTFATFLTWWAVAVARWPWALGAGLGLVAAALGAGLERLVFGRLIDADRSTVVVATIAVSLGLGALELKFWGTSPKILRPPLSGRGLELGGVVLAPTRLLALTVAIGLSAGLWVLLRRTTFGLSLLAVAQNPVAVRLAGVRLRRLSTFTWAASAVLGAGASLLVAPVLGAFSAFYLSRLLLFGFAAGVLGGGMTSLPGAVAGGIGLGVWEAVIAREFPSTPGVVDLSVFLLVAAALLDRARNPFLKGAAA